MQRAKRLGVPGRMAAFKGHAGQALRSKACSEGGVNRGGGPAAALLTGGGGSFIRISECFPIEELEALVRIEGQCILSPASLDWPLIR